MVLWHEAYRCLVGHCPTLDGSSGTATLCNAPLLAGCTTIAYEGAVDYPTHDAIWRIVEEFGVTGIFTSPTAVRLLTRYGESAMPKSNLDSLERVFCAGEVLNPPAWEWLQKEASGKPDTRD